MSDLPRDRLRWVGVYASCGRRYLAIGTMVVAMEGDLSRDPDLVSTYGSKVWTKPMLLHAAGHIKAAKAQWAHDQADARAIDAILSRTLIP